MLTRLSLDSLRNLLNKLLYPLHHTIRRRAEVDKGKKGGKKAGRKGGKKGKKRNKGEEKDGGKGGGSERKRRAKRRRGGGQGRGRTNREVQTVNCEGGGEGAVDRGVTCNLKKAHKP